MRTLIVGAGALGQVFGAFIAQGGGEVGCLVKPGRAAEACAGYALAQLRRGRAPRPMTFSPRVVLDQVGQVAGGWDAIWLCTHSTSLREPWLADLRDRAGPATIVSIGMGVDDQAALEVLWPAGQIVEVNPSVLAFLEAGSIHFWVPPGARAVSGEEARARPVTESLATGGLAAHYVGPLATAALTSAVNMPMVAAEEAAGWSGRQRRLGVAAAGEAITITAARLGVPPPARGKPTPFTAWLNECLFALVAPFDTRAFRQRHFTKTADQTMQMLDGWIAEGRARNLPTARLVELRQALAAARGGTALERAA